MVFIAFMIFATEPGYWLAMFAAILMGLAAGGILPVWGALMARVFGLLSYGRAMGLMGPLITLLVMPGYVITGKMFDMYGNYQMILWMFSGVILLAAVALTQLKLQDSNS